MEALAKLISELGLSNVLNAVLIYMVVHYYYKLGPKVERLSNVVETKNYSSEQIAEMADASTKALEEVAKSTENVAKSLEILNVTMSSMMELMKLLHEDMRETQRRVYIHDDRAEKMYTMIHKIYTDKYGKTDL